MIELIKEEIKFLESCITETNYGGWSTHLNKPMQKRIAELEKLGMRIVTGSLPKSIEPVSLIIEQAIKRADFAVQALKDIEDKLNEQKTVIVNKNQCDTER